MKNEELSLYVLYKYLWSHLNNKIKTRVLFVCILSILVSFTEFFSIASLFPFIAIFLNI